jgi:hypothetical protein
MNVHDICIQYMTMRSYGKLYIYIYADRSMLIKSFNCEDRLYSAGNPRDFFLRVRESCFFRESFGKVGYYESLSLYIHHSLLRATTSCRPGVRQWYRTFTFPFIGSSQASEGEASPQPNTMVLKHILAPAAGTA